MSTLEDVKTLLGIEDNLSDKLLQALEVQCSERIKEKLLFTYTEVPDGLGYVLKDFIVYRYNLLGDENKKSSKEVDYSASYIDEDAFLNRYTKAFNHYISLKNSTGVGMLFL